MIAKVTENEEEILRLWQEGMSGKLIAEKIGTTRNAVMGKLHRMREAHIITYKNVATRMAAVKHSVRMKERARIAPEEIIEEKPLRETVEDILPMILEELRPKNRDRHPVKFMDLDSSSCKYVVSGIYAKDFLFCNEVKKIGSSYCQEHHSRCNTPNILTRKKVVKQ